jgi:hypothetical protein
MYLVFRDAIAHDFSSKLYFVSQLRFYANTISAQSEVLAVFNSFDSSTLG